MSVPVVENIALDIEAAVNAITEANGFNQDLTALRPRRRDFESTVAEDGVVLVKQLDEDLVGEQPVSVVDYRQEFALVVYVIDSDDAATSIDTRLNQVKADLIKKLCEDRTRGGYAIDTIIQPAAEFKEGPGKTGVVVRLDVHYRTDQDDPYTQA